MGRAVAGGPASREPWEHISLGDWLGRDDLVPERRSYRLDTHGTWTPMTPCGCSYRPCLRTPRAEPDRYLYRGTACAQFAHNGQVTELILASPPPPEPATNYIEVVGIPLLVALVTAIITSAAASRRSRTERLASLRLETYRELIVLARRWESGLNASFQAEARGEDPTKYMAAWRVDADKLVDQMHVLPIIARKKSLQKIEAAFEKMTKAVMKVKADEDLVEQKDLTDAAGTAQTAYVNTVIEEGRKEIRRTRV